METITMKLNSPITDEQWNIITDAELERSDEIEFTTPSGKKVMYAKVRHGKWIYCRSRSNGTKQYQCSECGKHMWTMDKFLKEEKYCFKCGARMDEVMI